MINLPPIFPNLKLQQNLKIHFRIIKINFLSYFTIFAANTILGSVVIDSDNNIYIASGNNVLCIKDDGNLKWKVTIRGFVATSPSLSNDGIIF